MRKIKVLEIIGDSSLSGGSISLLTLVKGLDKSKFEITCACPPGPLAGLLKEVKGVETKVVPMRSKWDFRAIKSLRSLIFKLKNNKHDLLVHCHGVRGGWLGRLACLSPKKNAPKVVYTEHLWTDEYCLKNPLSQIFQLFGLWLLDWVTNKTIAVSGSVAKFLINKGITRPEKIAVIYNGIEETKKGQLKKAKNETKETVIGFVGSLTKRKGVEYLIKAISILKEQGLKVKGVIVGEGEERKRLEALSKKLKIDKIIEFKGLVEDPALIYPTFNIYVQPSLDEAFGIAALEAMSFGLPVIASNVGGLRELLDLKSDKIDNKSPYIKTEYGLLIPPENEMALVEAILKLIKDKKLAQELGKKAAERAKEFSAKRMVRETEEVYCRVV